MKKIIIVTALATMMSGAAFAQSNPNAPQPSEDGRGLNIPGTSATGTALDRADTNQLQEDARASRRDSAVERLYDEGETIGRARTWPSR